MKSANDYLHAIPRISGLRDAQKYLGEDVFLLPKTVNYEYQKNDLIRTCGLSKKWDKKERDLIRVIKVEDALTIKYRKSNVLTPLAYAESLTDIPWHLNTQAILFSRISQKSIEWIKEELLKNRYGKHEFDQFWLPFCGDIKNLNPGNIICIFNRRVAGWDGSHDRPVIELLGAGGHLPTIWDERNECFRELKIRENIQKEFSEELGGEISENNIIVFGGYKNDVTHELVVLCGAEVKEEKLRSLQEYAILNIDEDTKGIYLGTFAETMNYYRDNPIPFAGGKKAFFCNFPNQEDLMKRVMEYFSNKN